MVGVGAVYLGYQRSTWARKEYNIGYLQETLDADRALSRGEIPPLRETLTSHYQWEKGDRFRADGYMIARTLRVLGVPSSDIHNAFAKTASVEIVNQPLITLLAQTLESKGYEIPDCLAEEYLEPHEPDARLAQLIDEEHHSYFVSGLKIRHLHQDKMMEILEASSS